MKKYKTKIQGLILIESKKFFDERGYFFESYNEKIYSEIGIKNKFLQDNFSISKKNVLRGLHYQKKNPQGKLISVIKGSILDIAVDIRKNSKSYGKYFSIILSEKNNKQLWIPAGFAHGFMSLVDETIVKYNTSKRYSPKHERSLLWNDKKINIKWPDLKTKIISKKDAKLIRNKYD